VLLCSAVNHEGVAALVKQLELQTANHGGAWQARRQRQTIDEIRQALLQDIERRVDGLLGAGDAAGGRLHRVFTGEASIGQIAEELMREALQRRDGVKPFTNGTAKSAPDHDSTTPSPPHEGMPR
jgi:putative protein kinase ArgK-like GTPase of G3E family